MKDFLIGIAVGAVGAFVVAKIADKEEREKIKDCLNRGVDYGRKKLYHAESLAQEEFEDSRQSLERIASQVKEEL